MILSLPFVGREKEMARLRQLHKQRRRVLIPGAGGAGKSALVAPFRESLGLHVCPASEHLSDIYGSLEREFEPGAGDLHLVKRKTSFRFARGSVSRSTGAWRVIACR